MLQLRHMAKFNSLIAKAISALLLLLALFVPGKSFAQTEKKPSQSIFEYLTQKEALSIQLTTDLTGLNGSRKSDDYQPAVLTDANGQKWKVDIKSRGKFRRKSGFFPPIKIKFSKKDLAQAKLAEFNDIRVTLPFYEGQSGDDLVVREYIAYRMYEQMTSVSIRARLVKFTLVDSHVESWKHEVYAIFMEDDDELCSRLGAHEEEIYGLHPDSLQASQAALVSAFNYAIGNSDWEVAGIRNVKLLRATTGGKIVLIPYDFDFSGIVNAQYSKPANMSGLKTTKQRFLMADGLNPDQLRKSFQLINKERKNLYKLIDNQHLSHASQRDVEDYLDTFFDNLSIDDVIGAAVRTPMID
jgi:hypothetical protein